MAAKGTAAKSASGASMSKYDMEVEKRLQALEVEAHPKCHHDTEEVDTDRLSVLEARFDDLLAHLKNHFGDLED
jgi:hypothetical protein